MATLATADLGSDDSDADFVPTAPKQRSKSKGKRAVKRPRSQSVSGSSSASDDDDDDDDADEDGEGGSGVEEGEAKRLRLDQEAAEEEERQKKARSILESLKAESARQADSSTNVGITAAKEATQPEAQMVEVRRARNFAGETIYETVRLPASDPEAVAYLAARAHDEPNKPSPAAGADTNAGPGPTADQHTKTNGTTYPTAETQGTDSRPPSAAPHAAAASLPPSKPTPKPFVKRKPRQSLEAMASALDKGKKMTTLEKSKMDWASHTSSTTGMSDELAANRRSGGLLANREFLDRVSERKDGAFEEGKTKRR